MRREACEERIRARSQRCRECEPVRLSLERSLDDHSGDPIGCEWLCERSRRVTSSSPPRGIGFRLVQGVRLHLIELVKVYDSRRNVVSL
jgi:hypothetical protein